MRRELAIVAVVAILAWSGLQQLDHHVEPWLGPVVTEAELDASLWVKENTPGDALFGCDIFGCELLMGVAARRGIIGGDWGGNPDSVGNMDAYQGMVLSKTPESAHATAVSAGIGYVIIPSRTVYTGFGWKSINKNSFEDPEYFEPLYSNGEVSVYRVRE